MILKLGAINFNLLSHDEQNAVENTLMSVATGLDFPVQFLCATEVIDTRRAINEVYEHAAGEQSRVRLEYAQSLLNYLSDLMSQRSVLIKHTYAVVTCFEERSYNKTIGKLEHRCAQLINGLSRARITALPLTSEEIVDLLFKTMNRRKSVRPSDAVRDGALDYCVSGKGVNHLTINGKGVQGNVPEAKAS
jgi:Fe2+ transport system protein B